MANEDTALAKPVVLRPTVVSRLGLGLLVTPFVAAAIASSAWLIVGTIALGYVGISLGVSRGRIVVDERGVRVRTLLKHQVLSWSDITHYTYWSGPVSATFQGQGIERQIDGPSGWVGRCHHMLVLHGRGRRVKISSAFRGADRAVARILAELHERLAGVTSFPPFAIEEEGLRHSHAGLLPWLQIEVVRLRSFPARLQVMKHDKAFPWATTSFVKLPNGMLLLERLAGRGVPVDLGTKQLVTSTLLEACQRHAALPRAEIRRRRDR